MVKADRFSSNSLAVKSVTIAACLLASLFLFSLFHYLVSDRSGIDANEERLRIDAVMKGHEEAMSARLDQVQHLLRTRSVDSVDVFGHDHCDDANYSFYLYRNGRLCAWHNAVLPTNSMKASDITWPMFECDNGLYYVQRREVGNMTLFALFCVRSHYPYSNDYLSDAFHPSFRLPRQAEVSAELADDGLRINDTSGRYLFSVVNFDDGASLSKRLVVFTFLVLVAAFLFLLSVVVRLVLLLAPRGHFISAMVLLSALLITLYFVGLQLKMPDQLLSSSLYSLQTFSYDWWLPTLPMMMLLAALLLAWGYVFFCLFCKESVVPSAENNVRDFWAKATLVFVSLAPAAMLFAATVVINWLVVHSSDLIVYVGDIDINEVTFCKVLSISAVSIAYFYVCESVYSVLGQPAINRFFLVVQIAAVPVCAALGIYMFGYQAGLIFAAGHVVFSILFGYLKRRSPFVTHFSRFVWVLVLLCLYALGQITVVNSDKETRNRRLLAENLLVQMSKEDDAIAEQLLPEIQQAIEADTFIVSVLHSGSNVESRLYPYVRNTYFNSYFSRYDMQLVPCRGASSTIQLSGSGSQFDCREYFSHLVEEHGFAVRDADCFVGLKTDDKRPSYLGSFHFDRKEPDGSEEPYDLFLQLDQKNYTMSVGYPELLTNRRDRFNLNRLNGYSWARFYNGRLAYHDGEYEYPSVTALTPDTAEYLFEEDGYSHLVVHVDDYQLLALSYPQLSVLQFISNFSYLFVIMLIFSGVLLFVLVQRRRIFLLGLTISERVYVVFVAFVTLLFLVVCFISCLQSALHFDDNNRQRLSRSLSNVSALVSEDMSDYEPADITTAQASVDVDNILQRAANLYGVDVHFFSVQGRLVGTSRREIFRSGLKSPLINDCALRALRTNNRVESFVQETIGTFAYFSIYSPIYNGTNKLVGYVNVPLFNDVNALRKQVISTLEPIINSLLLVILIAVFFSYFLAKGIIRPLLSLSESLRQVDLNRHNLSLEYHYQDEIGEIVSAYNRMTDKLERSAERLAATERESTWREMARQVAHEIKNPLTPIKLSVQFLVMLYERRPDDFKEKLAATVQNVVEQIDRLAAVATRFSDMAKMKPAVHSRVDVASTVCGIATLFAKNGNENATVEYQGPQDDVFVMADPDLLNSVFNNLVKNALQSVPEGGSVDVLVSLRVVEDGVLVAVADNGSGIADDVKDKIFRPNFTTKSTGMGLGLAITKTIIDNSGGSIWFETEKGRGTTFFVRLPICR